MPHLENLAELFRSAFLSGAECEAELRGYARPITSPEDAETAWQDAVAKARGMTEPDEPEPQH